MNGVNDVLKTLGGRRYYLEDPVITSKLDVTE